MSTAALLAMILLVLVALLHVVRVVFGIEMTVDAMVIPIWASVVAALVAGGVAAMLWREGRRPSGGAG